MTGRRILAALVDGKMVDPKTRHERLVRVYIEKGGDWVVVEWRAGGERQYRKRANSAVQRAEQLAYAQGFSERLGKPLELPDLTIRQIWTRYTEAAFVTLRIRSRQIYLARWAKWERFLGREYSAKLTTPEDMDRFRGELTRAGIAVNQIRNVHRVVKVVYRWAVSRKLLAANPFADYRFEVGKDELVHEPAEFSTDEWEAILRAMGGQTWGSWRPHAMTLFVGSQGWRSRAALHLQWADVDFIEGTATRRKRFDKQGREETQPLTIDGYAAILTALAWREYLGYEGPWVFFSQDERSSARKDGREEPGVYRYQSWHKAFRSAQAAAGIVPKPYRGGHGFRKMSSGNVMALTNNPKEAMDWIGDTDPRRMREYLKKRDERMREIASGLSAPRASVLPQNDHTKPPLRSDARRGSWKGVVVSNLTDLMQRATGRIRTDDRVLISPPEKSGSPSHLTGNLEADGGVAGPDTPQNVTETATDLPHGVVDTEPGSDAS